LGNPSGDALSHLESDILNLVGSFTHDDFKIQLVGFLVYEKERPILRVQQNLDLLHYNGENFLDVETRGESAADFINRRDLLASLLDFPPEILFFHAESIRCSRINICFIYALSPKYT